MTGFLNINKPANITSFQVISVLRKILKIKQIGHAGTLDPLAVGVLPVAVGKATRLLEYLNTDKAYICECEFGKISDTYDTEGKIEIYSNKNVSEKEVATFLKDFEGNIEQIPPVFSAVHYNGKRLYELARKGEIPKDIKKRKITIYKAQLLEFDKTTQKAKIFIKCSGGTYIRTIVNDLGLKLQTGAIMTYLQRTEAAGFKLENSINIDELMNCKTFDNYLINPIDVILYKKRELNDAEYNVVVHGGRIFSEDKFDEEEKIILTKNSKIVSVGHYSDGFIVMEKVLV